MPYSAYLLLLHSFGLVLSHAVVQLLHVFVDDAQYVVLAHEVYGRVGKLAALVLQLRLELLGTQFCELILLCFLLAMELFFLFAQLSLLCLLYDKHGSAHPSLLPTHEQAYAKHREQHVNAV